MFEEVSVVVGKWIRYKILGKENVWEGGVNGLFRILWVNIRILVFEWNGILSKILSRRVIGFIWY